MIQTTVFKKSTDSGNDLYCGIVIKGHAGYAEEGEDIICAAVSGFEGTAGQEDIQFDFRFTSDISPESQLLMNSLVLGLQNIENDYGKSYINIRFKEV